MTKLALTAAGVLALLVGAGWLGLQIKPKPFEAHSEKAGQLDTAELPSDLPEPVRRHFQAALGEEVPRIETAVVWGRGEFNFNGVVWTHPRFKSYHDPGREFRRDQQITWFGIPILQGIDAYLDGKGSLEISGLLGLLNIFDEGEKIDQGQNLAMWAEAPFTTPSALVLDPRVRWESVDDTSARLIIPFGEQEEDSLLFEFDPETALMSSVSGNRYRDQEDTKTPWRGEYSDWRTVHGVKVPHRLVGTWEDWEEPYVILDLEGTEYNVDVSDNLR